MVIKTSFPLVPPEPIGRCIVTIATILRESPMFRRLGVIIMVAGIMSACAPRGARADAATSIWFGPNNDTVDLLDLFRHPQLWAEARQKITVLKLGPQQVSDGGGPHLNALADMRKVNAFSLLRTWGMKLAIEAPAIKKWDCSGKNTLDYTLKLIRNVQQSGGQVNYITLDGPLIDGTRDCSDNLETAAAKTSSYIKQIAAAVPGIVVGESEPYPAMPLVKISDWYKALATNGAKLSYFHMDANVHLLDARPQINVNSDLRAYRDFFKGQHMRFGVIFWSGYDPEPSDEAYYRRVINWVRRVHAAIGSPDDSIFESWVRRSPSRCSDTDPSCNAVKIHCVGSDGPGCGEKSVPANLPDNDPKIFSHTRLIDDAAKILS
jgi:hypothetical protein